MKRSFSYLFILFIVYDFAAAQTGLKENIICKQAMELIQKHSQDTNFIILDVRTPEEFNNGHIEKAINIDYRSADFQDMINALDKNKIYLVYCKAGGRSAESIGIMKNLNFPNLYHLYEGMDLWKEEGYKTETD